MNFEEYIRREMAWSRSTFGPGARDASIIDHIRKELVELEESNGAPEEWVDVIILALDGMWRRMAEHRTAIWSEIPLDICHYILRKQDKNELRQWPDWRTIDLTKAIEHVRTDED